MYASQLDVARARAPAATRTLHCCAIGRSPPFRMAYGGLGQTGPLSRPRDFLRGQPQVSCRSWQRRTVAFGSIPRLLQTADLTARRNEARSESSEVRVMSHGEMLAPGTVPLVRPGILFPKSFDLINREYFILD